MAEKVVVYVLSCGQGMTNWIEYYAKATDTVPSGLALVDLGGNGVGRTAAVDYIVARLQVMKKAKKATKIDAVVISHQDSDHWNLIPHLFDQLKKAGITLSTGDVWKSGQQWGARATRTVDQLGAISANKEVWDFQDGDCDYDSDPPARIWKFGTGVRLRTVAANVPLTSTASDMVRNGSSAVVAVELEPFAIILPGDATWETMMFINTGVYGKKKGNKPGTCLALSVPHHGALRTAVRGYAPDKQYVKMDTDVVERFATYLKTRMLIASSGYRNSHHHPMTQIMNEFGEWVKTNPSTKHEWMGYNFTAGDWARSTKVDKNIFSTVTTIAPPPAYYNGVFTITAGGSATFDLVEFRPADLSERVVYHADLSELSEPSDEARDDASDEAGGDASGAFRPVSAP